MTLLPARIRALAHAKPAGPAGSTAVGEARLPGRSGEGPSRHGRVIPGRYPSELVLPLL